MAWLSKNAYRRAITITDQSGTDLTDYQVKLVFDSNNFDFTKTSSDGSDIWFEDSDGNVIPHWIETWDTTNSNGVIWVKIPSLLANDSITIYMYYGSSEFNGVSDGNSVFELFDDFEGSELDTNRWALSGTGISVSNSNLVLSDAGDYIYAVNPLDYDDKILELKGMVTGYWRFTIQLLDSQSDSNNIASFGNYAGSDSDAFFFNTFTSGTWGPEEAGGKYTTNTWYLLRFIYDGSTVKAESYQGDTLLATFSRDFATQLYYVKLLKHDVRGSDSSAIGYVDWVRVRKHADAEPSISVGVEESVAIQWERRRAITITEQSGSDLTDYQVLIELNSDNFDFENTNADGSDIRFTDSDEVTELSYYIEEWDSVNKTAKIWVKVPSILANTTKTIYIYYGNVNAVSGSDGAVAFEFFDDFDINTLLINGSLDIMLQGDGIALADGGSEHREKWSNHQISPDVIIEAKMKIKAENPVTSLVGISIVANTENQGYQYILDERTDVKDIQIRVDKSYSTLVGGTETGSIKTEMWYLLKAVWLSNGQLNFEVYEYGSDGNLIFFDSASRTDTTYTSGYVGMHAYDAGYIDWIRVRKYASTEPAVDVGSVEYYTMIAGTVKLPDGTAVVNVPVIAIREDTNEVVWVSNAGDDGAYSLGAVPNVAHTVIVIPTDSTQNGDIKAHVSPVVR